MNSSSSSSEREQIHTHTHSHSHIRHTATSKLNTTASGTAPFVPSTTNGSRAGYSKLVSPNASSVGLNLSSDSLHSGQQRSVRDALAELNLKTRLLEDERDYYINLFHATDKAYEHHRNELQTLLVKERDVFQTAQRNAHDTLRMMEEENRLLSRRREAEKANMVADMERTQASMQADGAARTAQLRAEIDEHSATLKRMKEQTTIMMGEKEGLEDDIRQLLRRQEELRAEVLRRRAEQKGLMEGIEKAPKPFIPGGKTQKAEYAPASHNVNALISTIHNRNFMVPSERRRFKSPSGRRATTPPSQDDASANILRELMDLRLEYHLLAEHLSDPHADVTATSTRLREILMEVERKKAQLKKLRSEQKARSDDDKLHTMLKLIARDNHMAEQLYSDLIQCLRSPY